MKNYTKVDNNSIEIETIETTTHKVVISKDELVRDRDSLVRTINFNVADLEARNAQIQVLIDEIDSKLYQMVTLGIKTRDEILTEEVNERIKNTPPPKVDPKKEKDPNI